MRVPGLSVFIPILVATCVPVFAQESTPVQLSPVIIDTTLEGQELVGPYQQPRWSARGRFSADTEVYVLPPWDFFVDIDYTGTVPRHGETDNVFTQEFELGLPHRFQIAYENNVEVFASHTQETEHTIEARYALADWGKLPLNPTLFAEYHLGVGKDYEDGGDPRPDSLEVRLLFGEQFATKYQWALKVFHERQLGGDREWETGLSQALTYSIRDESLKVGIEMQVVRRTDEDTRADPDYEFDIGPSITWKPSRRTRFDVAPLFGVTRASPLVTVYAVFSIDFGKGHGEAEAPSPVSVEHR